jgi:hypothetical protein
MQIMDNVTVAPEGFISWSTLPAPEQEHIRERLGELAAQTPDQWPNSEVRRFPSAEDYFVLRANGELRGIFRRDQDGHITILAIVLKEMLERYFAPKP